MKKQDVQIFRPLGTDNTKDFTENANYSTQGFFFYPLYTEIYIKLQNGKDIMKHRHQPPKHF